MNDRAAAVSATQSVLESMTAGIIARKNEKAATLTPVGQEQRAAPTVLPTSIPASFPNDHPVEVVADAIRIIRQQLAAVEQALVAMEVFIGGEAVIAAAFPVDVKKAKEQAGDAKAKVRAAEAAAKPDPTADEEAYDAAMSADLAASTKEAHVAAVLNNLDAKAAEAQAAVFGTPSQPIGNTPSADTGVAPAGWVCPEHNKAVNAKTRKGRDYRKCPDCDQFERLA